MIKDFSHIKLFRGAKLLFASALDSVFPRTCRVCGCSLSHDEHLLCLGCFADMPRTGLHRDGFNTIHQRVAGTVPVDLAMGWFYYLSDSPYAGLIREAKYHDMPSTAFRLGRMYGRELKAEGFGGHFDLLLPVPLHRRKLMRRGYNQSLLIARGLASEIGGRVGDNLCAVRPHSSQTSHGGYERYANVSGSFDIISPERLDGLRVAVVDDVVTTGSTLHDCLAAIGRRATPASVSIITLGVAKLR